MGEPDKTRIREEGKLVIFGNPDNTTLNQIYRTLRAPEAVAGVLCADNHVGYAMPVGGVVAYQDAVSPNGVGFDISCGNKAVRTDIRAEDLKPDLNKVIDTIAKQISFGVGRTNKHPVDHPLFDDPVWQEQPHIGKLRKLAHEQLGTVGSGNHYVDLLRDEEGMVWIGVHFGSRGLGHRIATGFLNLAAGREWDARAPGESADQAPAVLKLSSALGADYWEAIQIAASALSI